MHVSKKCLISVSTYEYVDMAKRGCNTTMSKECLRSINIRHVSNIRVRLIYKVSMMHKLHVIL